MTKHKCALDGTDGPCAPARTLGWCPKHYGRYLKHGDPLKVAKRGKGVLLAELRAAGTASTDECVILTAGEGRRPTATLDGKYMLASRAVWILVNGDPGGAHVLHTCHRGEAGCINIRHLYLGDNGQNIRDMVEAGNSTRGQRSAQHKLTAPQVQEIRRLIADGTPYGTIAARYGVSPSTVYQINAGKVWAWLPADLA